MYKRVVDFVNSLEEKELKELYDTYCQVAFNFYIDCEMDKYERTVNIVNLIDKALRDKGIWNNK